MRSDFTIQKPSMQICFHKGDAFLGCPLRYDINLNSSWVGGLPWWNQVQRPAMLLGSQDRETCEQQSIQGLGRGHVNRNFDERLKDRLD